MRKLLLALCVLGISACTGGSADDAAKGDTSTSTPEVEVLDTGPVFSSDDEVAVTTTTITTTTTATLPPSNAGEGGKSLGPLDGNDLEVETEDGTVQIGNAELPGGLDSTFPLPDGLAIDLASETSTDLGFSGTTSASLDDLADFFAAELPAAGYDISSTQVLEETFVAYAFDGSDGVGQIIISQSPGGQSRTVVVAVGDGNGEEATIPD